MLQSPRKSSSRPFSTSQISTLTYSMMKMVWGKMFRWLRVAEFFINYISRLNRVVSLSILFIFGE